MSSNLMWKPETQANGSLPYGLKRAISRRLWDTDGSCGGGCATVDKDDIEFLKGLAAAKVDGASELINLINKHGRIVLWHEF